MFKKVLSVMMGFAVMFGCSCASANKTATTTADETEADDISSKDETVPESEEVELTDKDLLISYVHDTLIPQYGEITDPDLTAKFYFEEHLYDNDDPTSGYDIECFEGQEGIFGWEFADLNGDGDDSELIVLTRTKKPIKDFRDRDRSEWETNFEAFRVIGSEIVSMGSGLLETLGSEMYEESRVFIKHLSSGDEICYSLYGGGFYYYDGCKAELVVYKYEDNEFKKIADADYRGSDGFNENGEFSNEAIKAQLLTTANFWKEDYIDWDFDVNHFLVSWDEPDCTNLLYTDTSTNFDYDAFYDLNNGASDKTIDDYYMLDHVTNYMKGDTLNRENTQE